MFTLERIGDLLTFWGAAAAADGKAPSSTPRSFSPAGTRPTADVSTPRDLLIFLSIASQLGLTYTDTFGAATRKYKEKGEENARPHFYSIIQIVCRENVCRWVECVGDRWPSPTDRWWRPQKARPLGTHTHLFL